MNEMIRRCAETVKNFFQWGKIFLPLSLMRYYPPRFILRNPIHAGVKAAFQSGHEVAVVMFHIQTTRELLEQVNYPKYIRYLKNIFQHVVEQEIIKEDLIALSDNYREGAVLFLRIDYERHSISEINSVMSKITFAVERSLKSKYPVFYPQLEAGYMFIEKNHNSLEEAIVYAKKQASAIAEKKTESEFSEMTYTMKKIVQQKGITLLAQPIIDVETKEIRAWEMLARGPKGTVLENPLPLFSVARQTGKLYELELVVFEKAFQQMADTGCREDIFVNCTPLTLGNMRFIGDMKELLERYKQLSPKRITIEITERDSIDEVKDLRYNVKILRLMGFRVAVDDTGSGYSNLNTISEILPDVIKIDRSVIEGIDKNTIKESMLKGLLLVAKEAGSIVVAEGIESKEEASVLKRNRVDLAQGYFYARPAALAKSVLV
jgi:EAL domain-containing protein (putative c-di-GMP-specific phosphodiesterase class I)